MNTIAVIGGGPAGMMAAYAAAMGGARVTLFEKNEKLGKKLFLTGKGRCNITNARPQEEFFSNIPGNAKFLYSAFGALNNAELLDLLARYGLQTKVERGGRVFPVSDKSSDVIRTLERMLRDAGVEVRLHADVERLLISDGRAAGIVQGGRRMPFDAVILACGGLSYPSTGSTGEGYTLAKAAGHTVQPLHPSLIPLVAKYPERCRAMMGLTLKNVRASLWEGGKCRFTEVGELLFTHFGLSGPLILSASAHIADYIFQDTCIRIDLKPGLDEAKLDMRILRDFQESPNLQLKNAMARLLPRGIVEEVLDAANLNGQKAVNAVTREERRRLVQQMKDFQVPIAGTCGIEEAIITRGGVSLREVNASKMQSKHCSGLYFAGEMLDVDAYTGGYNLQIAFSTGYLAGKSAAENVN